MQLQDQINDDLAVDGKHIVRQLENMGWNGNQPKEVTRFPVENSNIEEYVLVVVRKSQGTPLVLTIA
jgi:hypothetical protein